MADESETAAEVLPPQPLTYEAFQQGLSNPKLTLDGSGIAFTKLDVTNKNLSAFGSGLEKASYIRFIDANNNPGIKKLVSTEIAPCKELITLSAAACNIIKLCDLSANKHLQHLDLTANVLISLKTAKILVGAGSSDAQPSEGDDAEKTAEEQSHVVFGDSSDPEPEFTFAAPSLLVLLLNRNRLASFDGLSSAGFKNLIRLEAASNALTSLSFPEDTLPNLEELIIPKNKLTSLDGLQHLPKLRVLNVDNNELTSLSSILDIVKGWGSDATDAPLSKLQSLSAKNNNIPEDSWMNLDGLAPVSSLRELRLAGNGITSSAYKPRQLELKIDLSSLGGSDDEDADIFTRLGVPEVGPLDFKVEVLVRIPQLSKVDDELVTPGERRTASEEKGKRAITEVALEKAAAEAAERAAKEAEEAGLAADDDEEGEEEN